MNVVAIRVQTEKLVALRRAKRQLDWTNATAIRQLDIELDRTKHELARLCEG
jgi:hypothetical protein